jgi:hypothetical protein
LLDRHGNDAGCELLLLLMELLTPLLLLLTLPLLLTQLLQPLLNFLLLLFLTLLLLLILLLLLNLLPLLTLLLLGSGLGQSRNVPSSFLNPPARGDQSWGLNVASDLLILAPPPPPMALPPAWLASFLRNSRPIHSGITQLSTSRALQSRRGASGDARRRRLGHLPLCRRCW